MTITVLSGVPSIAGIPGGRMPLQYEPASLIPGGVKLHGGNITVRPGHATLAWQQAFAEWDWDGSQHPPYPGIKAQIDRAKTYRCNCIRMIGDVSGIAGGVFTQATYHAHWAQLVEHALELGMWVYPCGSGGAPHQGVLGTDPAGFSAAAELMGDLGAFLEAQGYPNIVGIDLSNEEPVSTSDPVSLAKLGDMTTRVRAKCGYALTMSIVTAGVPPSSQAILAGFFDFLDLHFYSVPSTANRQSIIYQSGQSPPWLRLPFLIGEYGVNAAGGAPGQSAPPGTEDAARRLMFEQVYEIFAVYPWCMGALLWAMADQSTSPTDEWGIVSNAGVERAGADIFKCFPRQRIPASQSLAFP